MQKQLIKSFVLACFLGKTTNANLLESVPALISHLSGVPMSPKHHNHGSVVADIMDQDIGVEIDKEIGVDENKEELSKGYMDWVAENKTDPTAHGQKGHVEWNAQPFTDELGNMLKKIPGNSDDGPNSSGKLEWTEIGKNGIPIKGTISWVTEDLDQSELKEYHREQEEHLKTYGVEPSIFPEPDQSQFDFTGEAHLDAEAGEYNWSKLPSNTKQDWKEIKEIKDKTQQTNKKLIEAAKKVTSAIKDKPASSKQIPYDYLKNIMNIYYEDVAKHSMAVRAWDYVIDFIRDHMELSLLTRSQVFKSNLPEAQHQIFDEFWKQEKWHEKSFKLEQKDRLQVAQGIMAQLMRHFRDAFIAKSITEIDVVLGEALDSIEEETLFQLGDNLYVRLDDLKQNVEEEYMNSLDVLLDYAFTTFAKKSGFKYIQPLKDDYEAFIAHKKSQPQETIYQKVKNLII